MNVISPKKLIEVALPLDAINVAAAREKSIRHGHPSTLHLWWARRPLAAARAVIFAQLVHDPEDLWRCQNPGVEPNQQVRGHWTKARGRLFKIIEDLVLWENTTNEAVLQPAREVIRQSWRETCALNKDHPQAQELFNPDRMPGLHDPFAGGGTIPLEAQRLGLEAYASDLNPVAVLINKAMIEIPPKFAGMPPVHPGARASRPHAQLPLFDPIAPTDLPDQAWHSRGYLPHVDQPGLIQSITFRLADSVPAQVILQWKMEMGIANRADVPVDDPRLVQLREKINTYEDAGHGECLLKQPAIGQLVQDALLHFDGQRYRLLAWCVMPNHVHVLIETFPDFPLADVVQSWKSFTAKAANKVLGRKGIFWAPDYYDRFIRNAHHYESVVHYFEENPVKAGLVKNAADWKYSSAGARASRPLAAQNADGEYSSAGARASRPLAAQNADGEYSSAGVRASRPLAAQNADGEYSSAGARASRPLAAQNAGGTPAVPDGWSGAAGLAEDVRRYGQWMRDEAFKRIGHLYPPIEITKEMAKERPDLNQYVGEKLTVIAWLWARTVRSPNPAFSNVEVPLASTFILSSKEGKEAYVQPVILGPRASHPHAAETEAETETKAEAGGTPALPGYTFTVKVGTPPADAKLGTRAGKAQDFFCLMSKTAIGRDYVRDEGKAYRLGARLMAIVAEGTRGRVYLDPLQTQSDAGMAVAGSEIVTTARNTFLSGSTPTRAMITGGVCSAYGLVTWGHLFTPRQLVALTTFSDLVGEARERLRRDAVAAGLPDDDASLDTYGSGARAYAEAVSVYLAFAANKVADRGSTLTRWDPTPTQSGVVATFSRQALPMTWDFAEANPLGDASGNYRSSLELVIKSLLNTPSTGIAQAETDTATTQTRSHSRFVSTDPPYYDNIGYADLSDYFYVWLRRSLRSVFPNLLATIAVPKAEELVATPYRHGTKQKAEKFFLDGMTQVMHNLAVQAHPSAPITIYYAFKQSETESKEGTSSTGWETFLDAVLKSGLALTGTWPMRTELGNRMISSGTNALASSIILVCRPRQQNAGTISRRQFVRMLNEALPLALDAMTRSPGTADVPSASLLGMKSGQDARGPSPVAPVDLSQAIIGPGMAIFSRYDAVLEADGTPMSVRTALQLINRFLAEDDFDADTQFCLHWFEQYGWEAGKFGEADTLARAKGTAVAGVQQAGVIASGGGNVRLLKWKEYPADWNPATDKRLPIWEALHQLIRAYNTAGDSGAALVLKGVEAKAEAARQLAYRLYTLCERRGWAEDARAYNEVVTGWSGIESAAVKAPAQVQGTLFENEPG